MKNKTILALSALLVAAGIGGGVTASCAHNAMAAYAEGEVSSENTSLVSSSSSENSTSETAASSSGEKTTIEQLEDEIKYWKNLYDSFIVPLLGGTSILNIITSGLTIAISISKHRGEKKFASLLEEKQKKYDEIVAQATLVIGAAQSLVASMKSKEEEQTKALNSLIDEEKKLLSAIGAQTEDIEKMEKIKGILLKLIEVQGKMASSTQELVASGVAEDINVMISDLKELCQDGGKKA